MDTFNECKANLSQKPAIFLKKYTPPAGANMRHWG
jgi:hypothetical protein